MQRNSTLEGSWATYTTAFQAERALLENKYKPYLQEDLTLGRLISFVGNKTAPLLRLYRYKEAFSSAFVERFLDRFNVGSHDLVFDPFAGMGTTLYTAMLRGTPSIGLEKLPIAAFVARTLPKFFSVQPGSLIATFEELLPQVDGAQPAHVARDVRLVQLAFDEPTLIRLAKWKAVIDTLPEPLADIFRLLFFATIEKTSYASNDGQFMRLRLDRKTSPPDQALRQKVLDAETDLAVVQAWRSGNGHSPMPIPVVHDADARDLSSVTFDRSPTVLITSPPYLNRYDYTRSYCLELCFHFVRNFDELKALRFGILRSHIESKALSTDRPPHPAVAEVIDILRGQKLNNPRIPYMITAYFVDMQSAIREWGRVLAPGAKVALVVDNVRFQGEVIPVDFILSELAEVAGFATEEIVVTRYKGNSSQQMGRYGRIPVRESVVVWRKA